MGVWGNIRMARARLAARRPILLVAAYKTENLFVGLDLQEFLRGMAASNGITVQCVAREVGHGVAAGQLNYRWGTRTVGPDLRSLLALAVPNSTV